MPKRLGEILIERGKLDPANLERALKLHEGESREKIGVILLRLGMVSGRDLADALADQLDLPLAQASDYPELPLLEERLSAKFLRDAQAVPLREDDEEVALAIADPTDSYVLSAVQMASGKRVRPYIAAPNEIDAALERLYGSGKSSMGTIVDNIAERDEEQDWGDVEHLKDLASEAPVIRLVNLILTKALESRASDIHIEPFENRLIVRYRIDGVLHETESPPRRLSAAIISRVKIMASLDIAERRLPQDGRIKLKLGKGREMDFRVSVLPTIWGEKIVLRLLDKSNLQLDMTKLGFDVEPLTDFQWAIHQPWGMVLVTGPTGSGKTTTLYSALSELNKPGHNISTAEDPVEYNLHGINQVQMHDEIGLNFAMSLRAFLRQDPDIIMVGEIRDFETAEIAVKAALTGHLVLSTLHTNDAPATISRMLNMGVEPFLITASVNLVLAQRLARKNCVDCRQEIKLDRQTLIDIGFDEEQIADGKMMKGVGCRTCNGTGYKGRVALYEVMKFSDSLKEMVLQGASTAELKAAAIKAGMCTLRASGIIKVLAGMTSTEEILRVTMGD